MGKQKNPRQLAKFLEYVLGRRPDEFGLIPDPEGYVKIKELIKVMGEEEGWKYVRAQHLDEIRVTLSEPPIQVKGSLVRAVHRNHLTPPAPAENPPKLLYACVRRKAHAFVLDNGLLPPGDRNRVVLSDDPEMARRMGRRMDAHPVMVTVRVAPLLNLGGILYRAGESLFLADQIPPGCLTAPPLPKERQEPPKKETPRERIPPETAGSFEYDPFLAEEQKKKTKRDRKKKEIAWKKDLKRLKKLRKKGWPE